MKRASDEYGSELARESRRAGHEPPWVEDPPLTAPRLAGVAAGIFDVFAGRTPGAALAEVEAWIDTFRTLVDDGLIEIVDPTKHDERSTE